MVIECSQLRMYKLDTSSCRHTSCSYTFSDSASQISTASSEVLGGCDWMSNALLLGTIGLKQYFALWFVNTLLLSNNLIVLSMYSKLDLLNKFKNGYAHSTT